MVDFNKLRKKKNKPIAVEPTEIYRRLPKPPGHNDLHASQKEILEAWFKCRDQHDTLLKLHTGGGKTLVGLLMAQSTLNETGEPVLYLTPTRQLVQQTLEKAAAHGIRAVPYVQGQQLEDDFVNGHSIMVGTYKSLFNGQSKFGIRGGAKNPQKVSAVILDDAHAAFSVVREAFTLEVKASESRYESLIDLFFKAFKDIDKLGTLEDIMSGSDYSVLEVPYWAWNEQIDAVREQLKSDADEYPMVWPLLRDHLHLCHALVSKNSFTITPILPLVNQFPTFFEAKRRIYMSATIADDSDIIRTFDAEPGALKSALKSRSLAGISERMVLIPELMKINFDAGKHVKKLADYTVKHNFGAVILTSSRKAAEQWSTVGVIPGNSKEAEELISDLQNGKTLGPVVLANRYDGIDLPGNSCRLLVMSGLPSGTSNYEKFRARSLYGGATMTRMLAQRIEQGIGRGARGSGDNCVILLVGADFASWVSKDANFKFLTSATRAQVEMGTEISKEVGSLKELAQTIDKSFNRDQDWMEYHAETLADLVDDELPDELNFTQASIERKAVNLWNDGYPDKAIARLEKAWTNEKSLDQQSRGWLQQLAARISDHWGSSQRAQEIQREAYSNNRNLLRPKIMPPYRPLALPGKQAQCIVEQLCTYRFRAGFLKTFEEIVAGLHANTSASKFEQSLADFATILGLASERYDTNGEGPDLLWLLPGQIGFVIEAKSRKKAQNALNKGEHGQLLVAAEWFKQHYPGYTCVRVSVHPTNKATKAAVAGASHVLTYERLSAMISDARALLTELCESQLGTAALEVECSRILDNFSVRADRIVDAYLVPFVEE